MAATLSIQFLRSEALDELAGSSCVAGVIVTNSNHHRASARFAEQFSASIFGHGETFPHNSSREFRKVADADKICEGLTVIGIEGAAEGEIALHYAPDGGTFVIGDALVNFEPYGFTLLPAMTAAFLFDWSNTLSAAMFSRKVQN